MSVEWDAADLDEPTISVLETSSNMYKSQNNVSVSAYNGRRSLSSLDALERSSGHNGRRSLDALDVANGGFNGRRSLSNLDQLDRLLGPDLLTIAAGIDSLVSPRDAPLISPRDMTTPVAAAVAAPPLLPNPVQCVSLSAVTSFNGRAAKHEDGRSPTQKLLDTLTLASNPRTLRMAIDSYTGPPHSIRVNAPKGDALRPCRRHAHQEHPCRAFGAVIIIVIMSC